MVNLRGYISIGRKKAAEVGDVVHMVHSGIVLFDGGLVGWCLVQNLSLLYDQDQAYVHLWRRHSVFPGGLQESVLLWRYQRPIATP